MAVPATAPADNIARIVCSFSLEPAADGKLPTEFRIFSAGLNQTTKGDLIFDAEAAAAVMARYRREGVDLIVDLNHDSVEPAALAARSDASDARGWFQLELRAGELWAVNVRWTPDGMRRLTERTQRYISPVSLYNKETRRVTYLANVALVAMPATLNAAPLVAASKSRVADKGNACQALQLLLLKKLTSGKRSRRTHGS